VWKRIGLIGLLFVLALLGLAFDSFRRAGEFGKLTPRPLDCRAVGGVIGPEDITVDRGRDVAYISATDARAFGRGQPAAGGIYRYALGDPKPTPLYAPRGDRFHPHGIGFFSDGQGPDLLYVVDHETSTSHAIAVFEVDTSGLHYARSIHDPLLVSPNDVVAVARDELYITNDHGVNRGPAQLRDDVLRREHGQIVHVKAGKLSVLASDLAYPNGINVDASGTEVYVAESVGRRMRVYRRTPRTGALKLLHVIELGTGPDNIELAPDGSLFIAGHPKLLTFLRHASNPNVLSPSEVVRVAHRKVEPIYLDLGSQLSASTVATPFHDRLLIGTVFADHFLDCKLP
jgi:arylesterase/paraoxonase